MKKFSEEHDRFTVRAGQDVVTVAYSQNDADAICLPLYFEGYQFFHVLGRGDNFTVAHGTNTKAWTKKVRVKVLEAAQLLLEKILTDRKILEFKYSYSIPSTRYRGHGGQLVLLDNNEKGFIYGGPGAIYCSITLKIRQDELGISHCDQKHIDLRNNEKFLTTKPGLIRIHKKPIQLGWYEKLPSFISFLQGNQTEFIEIRHHSLLE